MCSDLSVTTCHSLASVGTRLEYDNDGRIKNKTSCAREVRGRMDGWAIIIL